MLRLNLPRVLNLDGKSLGVLLSLNISGKKDHRIKSKPHIENKEKIINGIEKSVSVALIGGGITPAYTALLLKQESLIKSVNLADFGDKGAGLLLDASHVDTSTKIKYFSKNKLTEAIRDVEIIALMNEDDFIINGKSNSHAQFMASYRYVKNVAQKIAQSCPTALLAVFAQPVTANLPLISEIYKSTGWWDPDRIIGSLAIDSMRVAAMAADLFYLNPGFTSIPIVGGADPCTIVPLLSQARPTEQKSLIRSLRASDNELAIINNCGGGPKLSIAAAATKLIMTLAGGYCGFKNSITSAYVRSNVLPACQFFANELEFGPDGVSRNFGLPKLSPHEIELIEQAIPIINANVDLAMNIIHKRKKSRSNMCK